MGISTKIYNNPFVRISLPIILGIIAAQYLPLRLGVMWTLFTLVYLMAWFTIDRKLGYAYIIATLILCSAVLSNSYRTRSSMPEQERLYMCLQVADNPYKDGRWQKTTATVVYYKELDDSLGLWNRVDHKIILNVDTCYQIALGEQFACRGYINRFDVMQQHRDFASLMNARGYVGTLYLTRGNLIQKSPTVTKTPIYYAQLLQNAVVERIDRLGMSVNEHVIAATMVAGEKRGIDKTLREAYARVGASHLLAVSGLHIGIVFAFLNILLYLLPIFSGGHIVKNVVVIVAIWSYAALSGLSPSVVRAAMMFSGAQIALASSESRDAANVMLGTAAVMLCLNPNNLFDISFQLSFAAVFFIILMFVPLYKILRTRNKYINLIISVTLVGVIATLGTLPWVSYKFGNVPLIGILIGPILILYANFILWIGVGWVIAPIVALRGVVSWALEGIIWLQNELVTRCAAFELAAIEYRMPIGLVVACYVVLGSLAVWLWSRDGLVQTFRKDYDDTE